MPELSGTIQSIHVKEPVARPNGVKRPAGGFISKTAVPVDVKVNGKLRLELDHELVVARLSRGNVEVPVPNPEPIIIANIRIGQAAGKSVRGAAFIPDGADQSGGALQRAADVLPVYKAAACGTPGRLVRNSPRRYAPARAVRIAVRAIFAIGRIACSVPAVPTPRVWGGRGDNHAAGARTGNIASPKRTFSGTAIPAAYHRHHQTRTIIIADITPT